MLGTLHIRWQMLVRIWGKGDNFALLVGVQIGAATMEISAKTPPKLEIDLPELERWPSG